MAVSNQEREAPKVIKKVAVDPGAGQAQFRAPASGLDRVGITSTEALKGKKIGVLSLKGVSNY